MSPPINSGMFFADCQKQLVVGVRYIQRAAISNIH